MNTSPTIFCEYCGAANEAGIQTCCFCDHPLDEVEARVANTSSFTSSNTLSIGVLLKDRYRIVKTVGQGGMGTVYCAQDTNLNNRIVALKELIISDSGTQEATEAIEAFKREATLLAGLQHANLPSVFEHFQESGHWYMVMTFIQGETLEKHLEQSKSKKLPPHEVLEIGKQLSSVLYYLHNQYPSIIFRDVKPANIIRTRDGRIYLVDFGVARRFKPGQKKDTIPFGSLGYAAPEQFGKAQTTPRSDIYGLGATLYELLTGHEPASAPLKFPSIRTLEPSLPSKLATLITQMLDLKESKRPANMLIVEQKLQEVDSAPWQANAYPSYTSSPAPKSPSNRPSWRTTIVLCTLLTILGLLFGGGIGNTIGEEKGQEDAIASYQMDATATTEKTISATATAVQNIALPDPYPPAGTLALFDSLSKENQWQEYIDSDWGGSCLFNNDALEITQAKANRMFECDEGEVFKNVTIQVKMTITRGTCGGIIFRENDDDSQFYKYETCTNGSYYFYEYISTKGSDALTLASGTSRAIKLKGEENTLAVVANGTHIDLYINEKKVTGFADKAYDIGTIGFCVDADTTPTTALFQDALIWALP